MKMRKLILALLAFSAINATADEGMWTLYNLPNAAFEQMKAEGFQLTPEELYGGDNPLKDACVNFSGYCSGVVVSPDGLVFTNHHCGFESIRSHSSVEHDYMKDGFYAKTQADELPNEGMFVSFMVEQRDITPMLDSLGMQKMDDYRRALLVDSVETALTRQIKAKDSTLTVEVLPFFERNRYYLTTYRTFNDLRLVFAPTSSMGKFGGDTDNWMWPRQTCDFSVFRIYCDPKTGGPANYSEDNVPYRPKRWAKVSTEGYVPGDFAMTVGYPGSTSRYLSSYGIEERRNAMNEPIYKARDVKLKTWRKHMDADQAVRIKYDTRFATTSNYWKNFQGMNRCIDSIGLIQQKRQFEAEVEKWCDTTKLDIEKPDFALMKRLYAAEFSDYKALCTLSDAMRTSGLLTDRSTRVFRKSLIKNPKDKESKQYVVFDEKEADEWDEATDKETFATMLDYVRQNVDTAYLPEYYKTIDKRFMGNSAYYVDYLYKNSILMENGKKIYVNRRKTEQDLGVLYGIQLRNKFGEIRDRMSDVADSIETQERLLTDCIIRMQEEKPHYSDANFTMRLSYGQVGSYELNGHDSGYYTDAESIVEKMKQGDRIKEYKAQPELQQLMAGSDFGSYRDKTTGKMHLCFLTNNDITGGNSGSPVFNGKGELIGLAFDGNWESLASDIFFDTKLSRCISVDIRFVLFMMDRWGHADRLINEVLGK